MNISFWGFNLMDYKGEEINDVILLKKMMDSLIAKGHRCYYLYNEGGGGINDSRLYEHMNLLAKRISIDKHIKGYLKEYKKYSKKDLKQIIKFNCEIDKINNRKNREDEYIYIVYKCLENLKELDGKYNIDIFIFFGSSIYSNIIKSYCQKNNKKYYNVENGYFRPFTLMVDPKGVNFNSSIPRDSDFYKKIKVDKNRLRNNLLKPEYSTENLDETLELRKKYYEYYSIKIDEFKTVKKAEGCLNLDYEYIYIPFQLESDSQLVINSPNIKKMRELVKVTERAIKKVNKKNGSNIKIVYKVHPLYKSEENIINIKEIENICNNNDDLILLFEGNNQQLIENSLMVITINSTVGIEALCKYKPVITLGNSIYNINGVSFSCFNINKLDKIIEKAMKSEVDKDYIDKFLYYLRFNYFMEIFRKYPDNKSVEVLVDKILYQ